MVSVIFGRSYHTDVCSSVHVSDKFGFGELFDVIKKTGGNVMIDS